MAGIPVNCIFVEQTTQQTTTSSAFVDISGAEITSGNFTVGEKYLIMISSQHGGNSTGEGFGVRTLHGSTAFTESEANFEPAEAGALQFFLSYGWFTVWTAVSGEGIKLQFNVTGGATAKADQISMVAMSLKDLVENTDYFFDLNSTSTALTTTFSSTNNASITINPALASDWLVMANSRLVPEALTKQLESKIETTGGITSSLPLLRQETESDVTDLFNHFMIRPFSLTAVSHTFTEQSRNFEASNGNRTHSAIFAINMSRFKQHSFSYTEAFVAGTAGTSEIQTTSITPTELRDVWVGTFYVFDPTGGLEPHTGARMQVDNVDQPATQTSDAYELSRTTDPDDLKKFYIQSVENLSASAHNIDLDVFDTNVNNQYGRRVAFAIECALTDNNKDFTVDALLVETKKTFTVDSILSTDVRVQRGTVSFTGTSTDVTIPSAIVLANSFLIFQYNVDNPAVSQVVVRGQITSTTNIHFERTTAGATVDLSWYVVEDTRISSQRGGLTMASTTENQTITSVDTAKSFSLSSFEVAGSSWGDGDTIRHRLTSATNLEFLVDVLPGGFEPTIDWEVVEYTGAVVQRGIVSFGAGQATDDIAITSVDLSRSIVHLSNTINGAIAITPDIHGLSGELTTSTNLHIERDATGNSMEIAWEVTEFPSDVKVQSGVESLGTTQTVANVAITSVDLNKTAVLISHDMKGGRTNDAVDDNPHTVWYKAELTTSTNLQLTRASNSTGDVSWFVIEFGAVQPITKTFTIDALIQVQGDNGNCGAKIQMDTATFETGQTSLVVNIEPISLSNSFLITNQNQAGTAPNQFLVLAELGTSTITFTRNADAGTDIPISLCWYVVEYPESVSSQRGTNAMATTTVNQTITSVDITKSFPITNWKNGGVLWGADDAVRTRLTSSTNLELFSNLALSDTLSWQVIEYTGASVQRGIVTFDAGVDTSTDIAITTVDRNRSIVIVTDAKDATSTPSNAGLTAELTTDSNLHIERASSTGNTNQIAWVVIQFPPNVKVQFGTESLGTTQTIANIAINQVKVSNTLAFLSHNFKGGRGGEAVDQDPSTIWYTSQLTSATNLQLVRGLSSDSTSDVSWFVVEFTPSQHGCAQVDGCIQDIMFKTFTVDACIQELEKEETFLVDAILSALEEFTVDGRIAQRELFTIDARLSALAEFTVDAIIVRNELFTVDSRLSALAEFTVDARLSALAEFTVDAIIVRNELFTVDAKLVRNKLFTVDSRLAVRELFTVDARLSALEEFTVDARLAQRETFTVDARLSALAEFTIDARLSALAEFDIDTFIELEQVFNFTVDGLIQGEITIFFLIDAFIQDTFVEDFFIDSRLSALAEFTVDAELRPIKEFTVDALLGMVKEFDVDARLAQRELFTVDAVIVRNALFDIDAVIVRNKLFDIDAVIVRNKLFTIDARLSALAEFTVDARLAVRELFTIDSRLSALAEFTIDSRLSALAEFTVDARLAVRELFTVDARIAVRELFTVDARLSQLAEFTVDGRIAVRELFTIDAELRPIQEFTIDAFIQALDQEEEFLVDARLRELTSVLVIVDAFIQALDQEEEFLVDAFIQVLDQEETFLVDSILKKEQEETFLVDAIIKDTFDEDFLVDAFVKALDQEDTFLVDSRLSTITAETFIIDGLTQGEQIKPFLVDSQLAQIVEKDFTVDAFIAFRETFTIDATLSPRETFTVDGKLKFTVDETFTVDGIPLEAGEKIFLVNALVQKTLDEEITVDAILGIFNEETFTVDAFIKAFDTEKTFTIDARTQDLNSEIFDVDAILKALGENGNCPTPATQIIYSVASTVFGGQDSMGDVGQNTRQGVRILAFQAGNTIKDVRWNLSKKDGGTTGTAFSTIRDQGDNILAISQALDVSTLGVSVGLVFLTFDKFVTLQEGDRVLIEFTGGTGSLRLHKNTSGVPGGFEKTQFDGSYSEETIDAYGAKFSNTAFSADSGNQHGCAEVDGLVKEFNQELDFTVDGILGDRFDAEFTVDGLVLETQTLDFTVDTFSEDIFTETFTIDGIPVDPFSEIFCIDSLIETSGIDKTFTVGAIIQIGQIRPFQIDAVVTGAQTKTFTVDAQIFLPNITNFEVDGFLIQPVSLLEFTVDAELEELFTQGFTINSILIGAGQKVFIVDGLTLGTQTNDFTIDADLRNIKTTTFDVDAVIKLTGDVLCAGTGIVFSDSIPNNAGWTNNFTFPFQQIFVDDPLFPNVIRIECMNSRLYTDNQAVKSLGISLESKTDLVWEFKHEHITPCAGFRALSEFALTQTNTLTSDIFQGAIKYRITVLASVNRVQARLEDSSGNVVFTSGILNLQPDTTFYPRVSIINDGNDLQLEMFTDSARTVNVSTDIVSTAGVNNETLSFIQVSAVASGGMGRRAREEFDDITINTSRCPRFSVDSVLIGEVGKNFTVDANIVTINNFTVDAVLKELGELKSFSVDAFLGIPEIDFTVDAVLSAQGKVTVDGLIQALGDDGCSGGFFFDTIDDATPWTVIGGSQIVVNDTAGIIEWNALRGGATVNERFAFRKIPNFADNEGEIRIRVKVDKITFNLPFFPTGRFMVLQNNNLHPNPSTGSSMQLFLGNGGIFANINDGTNGVSTTPPIEFPNGTTKFLEAIYDPVAQTLTLNVYTDANFTVHDTGSPVQANASSISMTGLTFTHVITSNVKNSGPARIITAILDDFTIGKAGCPTFNVDSIVKAFDTEKTFTIDAEITRGKIFLVDSILTLTAEEQFTVDSRLSALEEFNVDAKIAFRETFTIDGSTLGTVDKDFTIDGITIIFPSGLILIDAIVQIQGTNKVFTVDSIVKAFDTEKDFTVDSQLVQDEIPKQFTIDGRIVLIQTTTFDINGIIKLSGENGSCNFFPGTNLSVDTGLEQFIGPIQPDHEVGVEQLIGQEVTLSNQQVRSVSFLLRSSNFPNEIIPPMPIDAQVWSGVVVGNLGGETTEAVSTTVINASNTSGDLPPGDWTLVKFEFDVNTTPFLTGDFVVGYRSLSSVFGPAGVGTAIPVISNSNVIPGSAVHRKGSNSGLGDLDEWGFLSGDSKDMIIQLEVVNGDDIILGEGNQCPPVDAILVNTPAEPLVDAVLVDRPQEDFIIDGLLSPLPVLFEVDGILVGTQLPFTIDAQIVPPLATFLIDVLITGDGQKPFLVDALLQPFIEFEIDSFVQAINKNAPLFNINAFLFVERTKDFTVDGTSKFFDKVAPFTVDAQVIFFPSQLPQVDGLLKRVGKPKFFFVDAFIQKLNNLLFPFTDVDALIVKENIGKTFLVDVLLVDDKTTDFDVDARLSTPGAPKLFSVDALTNLQNGRWQTDALLSKTRQTLFLVDSLLVVNPQKLFLIDGITIGEVNEEFIIDGLLQVEAQEPFLVDARILQENTIDYTVNAIIKDFGVTVDFTVDASLVRIGEYLVDSFVQALGDGILGNGNNGSTNDSNSTNPYVQQPTDDNTITLPIGTLVGQRLRLPTAPVRIDDYTFVIHRAGTAGTPTGTLTGKIYRNSIAGNSISGADLIATSDNVVNLASITTNTNGQNVQFTFTNPPETTVDDNVFIGFDIAGSNEQMFLHTESTGTVIDGGDVNVESTGVWGVDLGVDAVLTINIDLTPRQRGSALMHAFIGRFIKEIIGVDALIKAIGGVSPSPLGEAEFTVDAQIRFKREAPPTRVDAILIGSQDFTVSAFVGDTLFTGLEVESVIVENNSDGGVESVIVENNSDSGVESVIGQDT